MCLETELISTRGYHFLPGRFRVAVPAIKDNPRKARFLEEQLRKIEGIAGQINSCTGRVLLVYNPRCIDPGFLLQTIARTVVGQGARPSNGRVLEKGSLSGGTVPESALGSARRESLPWHALRAEQVLAVTGTSPRGGLSSEAAQQRLQIYGPNRLTKKSKASVWRMLAESLRGFMSKLLLGAAAVSFFVGESADALVITTIVILQAALETFQGYRAEQSLAALQELSAPQALAVRDGKAVKIPAAELVFGDLIQLRAGDRVPADARLLRSNHLLTDESCLTGESIPVVKSLIVSKNPRLFTADRLNMLFAGTGVIKGQGLAVVTATGMRTEMGRIAALLGEAEGEETSLHRQMELLGAKTTRLVFLSVGAIVLAGLLRRRPLGELLSTGVSLAVGAIPEGLPAVVTVALAFGVQRMARRNAVVRRLSAVETLGGVTAICADKTGTLTANEMTVKQIYTNGKFYFVSGEGYRPAGAFYQGGRRVDLHGHPELKHLLLSGALCNNARLQEKAGGRWTVSGDPTEGALLTLAAKGGLWPDVLQARFRREREIAFDSRRRMMSVFSRDKQGRILIHTKGAAESLLPRCSKVWTGGEFRPLYPFRRRAILEANQRMAQAALRVLGLAVKAYEPGEEEPEEGLVFLGLVGMVDPPRRGVKKAIRRCQKAGIKVIMITGDHQKTAEAVARKLGLAGGSAILPGRVLEDISEGDLVKIIEKITVFARTSPGQKLRIVRALQKKGHIVAMTGDGINDAPAVKEADIGIAMGRSGTDVTREAAGIILSDDNFSTIVAGVEEGRAVAANIGRAIRYILPGNWGQVLAVFLASISGYAAPLVPSQILWINLVTEGFPALALAADPPGREGANRSPLSSQKLLSGGADGQMVGKALLSGLTTYGLYAGGLSLFRWSRAKAQSMAFAHVVMGRVFSIFDSLNYPAGKAKNPYVLPAAGLSAAMLLLTIYFPALNPVFKTVPLALPDWGIVGLSAGVLGRLDRWLRKRPGVQN